MPQASSTTSAASGVLVDASSIGRRITHATNSSTTSFSTFQSLKPQSLSVPRIRILLAPYMSPFVVPMHKVETWDVSNSHINPNNYIPVTNLLLQLLNRALQNLFGLDLFNSSIRITDHQGNSILPSVWSDLLEQDMTIIVDTYSLQAENSPILFEAPVCRTFSPPMSPTYTIRESEDSCYETASTFITPRGGIIGQAVPMKPPNPMTTAGIFNVQHRKPSMGRLRNWSQQKGEEERRNNSASMFTGMSSRQQNAQASRAYEKEREREDESMASKRAKEWEKQQQQRNPGALDNKQKSKNFKSTVTRFAKAVLCVLSAGTIQPSSKEGSKVSEKPKRVPEKPRRTITMEAIENNPAKAQPNVRIHRIPAERRGSSIPRRRGIPPLSPVVTPALPTAPNSISLDKTLTIPSARAPVPRRSKSLSHLKLPTTLTGDTLSSAPSPPSSTKSRSRSKSFCTTRRSSKISVISPPIPPRRPSLDLGINAQYKCLSMDKAAIQEMFNDLDGATLGSGTRSRSGTGDTSSTAVPASPSFVALDVSCLPPFFSRMPSC